MAKYGGGIGYSRYRGRTPKWKIGLAVVLVLVILASGWLILLQKYLVYDDNGQARLEMPWGTEEPEHDALEAPDLDIQEPEPSVQAHQAFVIGAAPLTLADWEAVRSYGPEHGLDAVAVVLRQEGKVFFHSDTAVYRAMKPAADTMEALTQVTAADGHAVGLVSCFLDPIASKDRLDELGLKNTGGYIFYDGNNRNWLDPAKPAVIQYLSGLLTESAALGFDELVLRDFTFPTVGKLDKIAYSPEKTPGEALTEAFRAFRTALDESGHQDVALSVELPAAAVLAGGDAAAGIDLAALANAADAIYVAAAPEQLPALEAAVEAAGTARLVPILKELPAPDQRPESLLLLP